MLTHEKLLTDLPNYWKASPAATAVKFSGGDWLRIPHLNFISRKVSIIAQAPSFIIVSLPPRHGKSELISHWLPVWFLSNFPDKRVGLASYGADFAAHWGRQVRDTIWDNEKDMGCYIRQDLSAAANWELHSGGGMVTAGIGGPFTGYGFDLIVIDDPIKNRAEANSATRRQFIWEWWTSTARTRLEPGGSVVIIMTRWHEDDLVGRLLGDEYKDENGFADDWVYLRLPALADRPNDPMGRPEGEPLWPDRYNTPALMNIRASVGLRDWAGLYQQSPAEDGGNILKDYWWQYIQNPDFKVNRIVQFWDTAFKEGQENDYSCCVTGADIPAGFLILDVWREKLTFPQLKSAAQTLYERWKPERINVEDAASGISLVQSFKVETKLPILAVPAREDKVSRAHSVTGLLESGRVFLPAGAAWLPDFLHECTDFPNAAHDDQVDAFVGVLTELRKPTTPDAQIHDLLGQGLVEPHPLGLDMTNERYRDTDRR